MLGAIDRPTKGEILVDGRDLVDDVGADAERLPPRTGRLHLPVVQPDQQPLGARERARPVPAPGRDAPSRSRRAAELLTQVGLGDRLDHHPYQLSGGEQQRVAIARALVKQPLLVLADEPTGELDSKTGDEIYKILRSMQQTFQTTLVVVTHDRRFITPDDLVLEIQDGQVAGRDGTVADESGRPTIRDRPPGDEQWRAGRSRPRGRRQSRRMTLPNAWFDASRAWASRTCSNAKTESTTGRTTPRSSQGRTWLANSRVAAIFSSMGRARSVVPTTVSRFAQHQRRGPAGPACPPSRPTRTRRPRTVRALQVALQGLGPHQVEDHLDADSARVPVDDLGEIVLAPSRSPTSSPRGRACSSLAAVREVPKTVQPIAWAIWAAAVPTPLPDGLDQHPLARARAVPG